MLVNLVHLCGIPLEGAKWAPGSPITICLRQRGAMLRGRVKAAAEE